MVELNKDVPTFCFKATNSLIAASSDYQGQKLLLYFYPKDSTPGCTQEGQDFCGNYEHFEKLNTVIFGISRDSLASHEKFKAKHHFPFELISDEDETLCKLFDVIKEKNMYGRKYMGIERSSFIIDETGTLIFEERKVKVKGHIDRLLTFLRG